MVSPRALVESIRTLFEEHKEEFEEVTQMIRTFECCFPHVVEASPASQTIADIEE